MGEARLEWAGEPAGEFLAELWVDSGRERAFRETVLPLSRRTLRRRSRIVDAKGVLSSFLLVCGIEWDLALVGNPKNTRPDSALQ